MHVLNQQLLHQAQAMALAVSDPVIPLKLEFRLNNIALDQNRVPLHDAITEINYMEVDQNQQSGRYSLVNNLGVNIVIVTTKCRILKFCIVGDKIPTVQREI